MQYQVSYDSGVQTSLVVFGSFGAHAVDRSHPMFDSLVEGLSSNTLEEADVTEMLDISLIINKKLSSLDPRISFSGSQVLFEGNHVGEAVGRALIELLSSDGDWEPLAKFIVKAHENVNPNGTETLFGFLQHNNLTLTDEGNIICYKAVNKDGLSVHSGFGVVDGETYENQQLPNHVGAVVSMPREMVDANASKECSIGLHVGSYRYATRFAPLLLTVEVNPRHVVAVSCDDMSWKMRTESYKVLEVAPADPYGLFFTEV